MKYFKLKFLTFFLTALLAFGVGWAGEVKDVLNQSFTGVSGTTYTSWYDKTGTSGAVYAGNSAADHSSIQLRATKGSAIVTTESGGKVKSITVTWNSNTQAGRTLNIYCSNTAYTLGGFATDFNNNDLTPVGTIVNGTSSTLSIDNDYSYIAFTSASGTLYLDKIEIVWETEGGSSLTPVTLSFPENSYTATLGQTFDAPTLSVDPAGAASEVTYSSSDTDVATVDASTGAINLVAAGTTTITAEISGNDTYNNATASYTLTVEEAAQPGIITDFKETFTGCNGTGGNDNSWSGNIASSDFDDSKADNAGWVLEYGKAANACIKLGATSNLGSARTPSIIVTPGTTYTLKFKAAAWNGSSENTTLKLSATGGTISPSSVTLTKGAWTEYTITFVASENSTTITFEGEAAKNSRFFLDEVVLSHNENASATPYIIVDPESLTISDNGTDNSFTVQGGNLIDNIGVTPSAGFKTIPDPKPNEEETWGFVNNGGSVNGTVTVNYTGTELSTTGTVSMGTKPYVGATDAEDVTKVVNVTYLSDVYILGNYGDGWNFNDGSHKMSYNEAEGTYTAEYDIPANSYIVFARKLSENALWNDGRSYFGPDHNGNLEMDADNKSGELNMSANTVIHIPQAGFYQFTINASGKTFTITRTLPQVEKPKITPNGGNFAASQTVTITTTTDDASIYYTTDESEPSAENGTLYEGELTLSANTTLKAIAVKDGMRPSEVATATFTKTGIDDLAGVIALGGGKNFTFVGNVVVTFKGTYGNHTLVGLRDVSQNKANGHGGGVFHNTATDLTVGQVLQPGWTGKTNVYNGLTQIENASGIVLADQTAEVLPFERSGFEFTADNLDEHISEYLILRNITISNDGKKATWTDDSKKTVEYTLYDRFNVDYKDGNYKSLTGVLNVYYNTIQIYPLELEKAQVEAGLTYGEEPVAVTAKIGEDVTEPELTNPNNLTVTYSSSDTNVATVDANGNVTAVGAGEATITASFAGDDNYLAGEASYTITVSKKDATLSFGETTSFTVYAGNKFTAPELTTDPKGLAPITYSIEGNDSEIVLFDEEDGTVVVGDKTGTVTITATFAGNDTYNKATASYTLNIIEKKVATLSFDVEGITVYPNAEDFNQPKLTTTPENLTVTYTSTDDNIATVVDGVLMIGDKTGTATITATFAGNDTYGTATASYTVTVEPRPIVVADDDVEFELYVGQTETKTFTVMAENLKGDITLTLNDETGFYSIEPTTIDMAHAENATVTVTYAPTTKGIHDATVTLSTKDAEEDATVTLIGMAEVQPVVAMPTFSLVAGSYTGVQTVIISCATESATISYSTDGGQTWTEGNTVNVDKDMTIMAKASKAGYTISETATAAYIIDIPEELPTITPFKGYYQIKNNGNGMYANIAGRKTLNFTDAPADKAGTVIWLETNDKGQVQSIRSQAADLQGYANRAMLYVPEIVELVADKLNADGVGNLLGHEGLEKIMEKFNESFDHHLYVEQAGEGWRLYGKTPSMQPVVEFYRENTAQVEAKLPMLESFINSALNKLKEKIGGQSVFTEFSLRDIWQKMGGTLTEPIDDASTMAFYREVLNNKNYVWDFAYQTAMIYVNNVKKHPRWSEVEAELGEYAQYIDKIDQIRPDFKYYVVADGNKPDFISEGNKDIINDAARTIWTLEDRSTFTVNIPANAETTCDKFQKATTLYTDFAYELPEGVTAYKVTDVVEGTAITEALSGVIPAQTPVLLMAAEAGDKVLTLSTEAGTAVTDNLLVGPDYLINTYKLTTPQVEGIFNMIKEKLGEDFYNTYVKEYEHLMYLNSGTVNNKYFWGLKEEDVKKCTYLDEEGVKDYVVRGLEGNAFVNNKQVKTNKAFLVSEDAQIISLNKRGDVNHDGKVNIKDVTDLIDRLLDPENTAACPICSDFNLSGKVDIKDVTDLIDVLLTAPYAEQEQPSTGSQD